MMIPQYQGTPCDDDDRRHTLVIADDDPFVRSALSLQLGQVFRIVGAAPDADGAIELADSHRPNLAIIDVQMPGGGGLHATRRIRQLSPTTAVIALSSDESDVVVRQMLSAGALTYVRKGVSQQTLVDLLLECVDAHPVVSALATAGS